MRSRDLKRVVVVMAAAAALFGDSKDARADAGFHPTIEVHGRTTTRDGGIAQHAIGTNDFVPGRQIAWLVTAGSMDPEGMTLCGGGVSEIGALESALKTNSYVWSVTLRPTKYETGRETFDLEWARYAIDAGAQPTAQGRSTITLLEGQRQVIDLVHGAAGTRHCTADTMVVEVGAGVKEDARFAQAILQYDLWLTHRGADGQKQVRHFIGMGKQGADIPFAFAPFRFPLPDLIPNQISYDIITSVQGTIKGRLQPDGRIALDLETDRRDGMGPRGEGPIANGGGSGRKQLEVAPDEAIEIQVPVLPGRSSLPATSAALPPRRGPIPPTATAVSIDNGRVVVDDVRFFEGQQTSIVLQVRRVG